MVRAGAGEVCALQETLVHLHAAQDRVDEANAGEPAAVHLGSAQVAARQIDHALVVDVSAFGIRGRALWVGLRHRVVLRLSSLLGR